MVEKNLSNPEYSIEDLSRDMCMSRATLYRKITSITGSSPSDFVKNVRLRKAAELLKEGGLTIAEIADQVGFNTPSYFTKSFKKLFGVLPTQYNKWCFSDKKEIAFVAVDGGIIINMIHKVQLKCINFHVNEQKYILGLYK